MFYFFQKKTVKRKIKNLQCLCHCCCCADNDFYDIQRIYAMRCAIWYHLYNLKNVKNMHGVLLTLLHGCFPRFLNCTNGTKSRKRSYIYVVKEITDIHRKKIE